MTRQTTEDKGDKYRAPALDKGLDILEILASSPDSLTQSEIAKMLGRSTTEIFRMLNTLVRRHYVARSQDGDRYTLSLRLLAVANMYPPHRRMLDITEPLMRASATKMGQSVHLAIWENGEFIITASFAAPGNWRLSLRVGSVIGLYNTGSGLVLAAFQDDEMRHRMISEHQMIENETALSTDAMEAKLNAIRDVGYLSEDSHHTVGVTNISFPILDPFGNAIAALTCPFVERIDSISAPDRDQVVGHMKDAAHEITQRLNGEFQGTAV